MDSAIAPDKRHPEIAPLSYCRLERVTKMEFLEDRDAGRDYINELQAPYRERSGTDLAWLLGVVDDVSNENTLNRSV